AMGSPGMWFPFRARRLASGAADSEYSRRAKLPTAPRGASDQVVPNTASERRIRQTLSAESGEGVLLRPVAVRWEPARSKQAEAIRGSWSVQQPDGQISMQFFKRTAQTEQTDCLGARSSHPGGPLTHADPARARDARLPLEVPRPDDDQLLRIDV